MRNYFLDRIKAREEEIKTMRKFIDQYSKSRDCGCYKKLKSEIPHFPGIKVSNSTASNSTATAISLPQISFSTSTAACASSSSISSSTYIRKKTPTTTHKFRWQCIAQDANNKVIFDDFVKVSGRPHWIPGKECNELILNVVCNNKLENIADITKATLELHGPFGDLFETWSLNGVFVTNIQIYDEYHQHGKSMQDHEITLRYNHVDYKSAAFDQIKPQT